MALAKADLRSYVNKIIEARRVEVQGRINQTVQAEMAPIVELMRKELKVDELVKALDSAIEQARQLFNSDSIFNNDYALNYKVRDAQQLVNYLRTGKMSILQDEVSRAVRNTTHSFDFHNNKINEAVLALQEKVKDDYKLLDDIHTLSREAEQVIATTSTAKRGAQALKELGFDMENFDMNPPVSKALVIQKFSVDPAILKEAKR